MFSYFAIRSQSNSSFLQSFPIVTKLQDCLLFCKMENNSVLNFSDMLQDPHAIAMGFSGCNDILSCTRYWHTNTDSQSYEWISLSTVCLQMFSQIVCLEGCEVTLVACPQTACMRCYKVTLVALIWLYSAMNFQMCSQSACIRGCKVTLVALVWLSPSVYFQVLLQISLSEDA